ncbi:hypothetical protein CVT26_013911 [Gymnopilus dilepis]|uniref:NAD-dependent epimerase/dehydratase domain-containing protein n=1 Tax=Gymnopilus dilepis TaxID=231916 RepID=A0A409VW21_9AGAR|nr:hypothetical protein CVT26_013911 [Gymnopilus dilepis]
MPILEGKASQLVLVTGANGYIALWTVRRLLEEGFSVSATVRAESKAEVFQELFASYGDRFQWVEVADITKEGAFDVAVRDVDAIEHMASPLPGSTNGNPEEYSGPAVNGTLSLLRSALKFGSRVKRIVMTSSVGAIVRINIPQDFVFDESHWGDEFLQAVKEHGSAAPELVKYRASKVLSERAAWDFYAEHKAQIGWDLVVINPPVVIGPSLNHLKSPDDLNISLLVWYQNIAKEQSDTLLGSTYAFVDVRDVAEAHVVALKKADAGGERIIVCEGTTTWQDTRNILSNLRPEFYAGDKPVLPRGNPDLQRQVLFSYNAEKGKRILKLKYRSIEEITVDIIADFEARGWLQKQQDTQGDIISWPVMS